MTRRRTNISLKSYDDIFATEENRQETGEHIVSIPVKQIHELKNHPFKVLDDEDMRKTVDSIREYGMLLPAQIILTMLICMMNFEGGVFDFIFGLIGGFKV